MKNVYYIFIVSLIVLIQGCVSTKYFVGTTGNNVVIKKQAESDSAFSSINVYLDVYDVNSQCKIKYLGSVTLDKYITRLGFPLDKYSLLSFRFAGSSLFGSSTSSTSFDTLLKPRDGYEYEFTARYREGIYNVKARNKRREIDTKELYECNKSRQFIFSTLKF